MLELATAPHQDVVAPEEQDRVVTFALEGEICTNEIAEVLEMLSRYTQRGVRNVVLDFSDVCHLDYRGVRPLMARAADLRKQGGDIKVCGLSPYLSAIFRSAGAHESFDYFAAAPEARSAFDRAFRL